MTEWMAPSQYHAVDEKVPNNADRKTKWRPSHIMRLRDRFDGAIIAEFRFPQGINRHSISGTVRGGWVLSANGAVLDKLPEGQGEGLRQFQIEGTFPLVIKSRTAGLYDLITGGASLAQFGTRIYEIDGYAAAAHFLDFIEWSIAGGRGAGWAADGAREYKPEELLLTYLNIDQPRGKEAALLREWIVYPMGMPTLTQQRNLIYGYSFGFQGVEYCRDISMDDFMSDDAGSWLEQAMAGVARLKKFIAAASAAFRSAVGFVAGIVTGAIDLVVGTINALSRAISSAINAVSSAMNAVAGGISALRSAPKNLYRQAVDSWHELEKAATKLKESVVSAKDALGLSAAGGVAPASASRGNGHLAELEELADTVEDLWYRAGALLQAPEANYQDVDYIRANETIEAIGARNNVTVTDLIEVNGLRAPYIYPDRTRPLEDDRDWVLYPGERIRIPGTGLNPLQSNSDRAVDVEERLYRTDFEFHEEGERWRIENGKPVLVSGVNRIKDRLKHWDFAVSLGSSKSFPELGSQINALVTSWSDQASVERMAGLGVKQTLEVNPYIRNVRRVELNRDKPGAVDIQYEVDLITKKSLTSAVTL